MFIISIASLDDEKKTKWLAKNFAEPGLVPVLMITEKKSSSFLPFQEIFYWLVFSAHLKKLTIVTELIRANLKANKDKSFLFFFKEILKSKSCVITFDLGDNDHQKGSHLEYGLSDIAAVTK